MRKQFNESVNVSINDLELQLGALFDDPDFHAIHSQMSPFNLFEAVGAIRAELRHSNFLAYLLSPSRPHGLGTKPLVAVLRAILKRLPASRRPIMPLELIAGDLDGAIIYRERDDIDILIELPTLEFVVAIENKVGAQAREGQLERYSEYLGRTYSKHRRLLVFLTPNGSNPNHDLYVAYSYAELVETLENLAKDASESIPPETATIIRHYVAMVRRHIVQDDRLRALALTLYQRHKEAFEFVFECRPEPKSLLTVVREAVQGLEGLIEDRYSSNVLRFVPKIWDEALAKLKGDPTKWSKNGRGIMFEVKTYDYSPGRVNVSLILGPVDPHIRPIVYNAAAAQKELFTGIVKPMGAQWATIFSRDLLTSAQAKDLTFEAQSFNVGLAWSDFQANSLLPLINAVLAIEKDVAASG